jgi:hypothetical protein
MSMVAHPSRFASRRYPEPALDFDFTRGAINDAMLGLVPTCSGGVNGTRTNERGLIVPASAPRFNFGNVRTNLLPYSGFATGWNIGTVGLGTLTRTLNAGRAPDGSNEAVLVSASLNGGTAPGDLAEYSSPSGTPGTAGATYIFSFYVKAWTAADVGKVIVVRGPGASAYGTVTLTADWQRVGRAEAALSSSLSVSVALRGTTGSSNAADFLVWGAQLELGAAASPLIPTNGAPASAADCQGLLVEEQRTNMLVRSGDLSHASWATNGVITATANAAVAPDGTTTAAQLTRNAGTSVNYADLTQSATPGAAGSNVGKTYVFSVWLWSVTGTTSASLAVSDLGFKTYLKSITVTALPQRYEFACAGDAGWNAEGTTICAGINLPASSTVLAWGAQLEVGAFSTTYIPTAAAPVTRTADSVSMAGASVAAFWNQAAGTVVAEYDHPNATAVPNAYRGLWAAYTTSWVNNAMHARTYSTPQMSGALYDGLAQTVAMVGTGGVLGFNKLAFAYAVNDCALSQNAGVVSVDITAPVMPPISTFQIGSGGSSATSLCGHVKRLRYWPTRLPDATLQSLTA